MTDILIGSLPAERIRRNAAEQIPMLRDRIGRPPCLAAVAVEAAVASPLYFDVKEGAFTHAGALFEAHVLPPHATTGALFECIGRLNRDDRVDGIYVQYPLPATIDAQAVYDVIEPAKDVDGAARSSFDTGAKRFRPATAEAVLRLLEYHAIDPAGMRTVIVKGDPLFAQHLLQLFAEAGSEAEILDVADCADAAAFRARDIVVVASGVINGVSASRFPRGMIAIDVGYYHGGGRGDIDATPADVERMRGYAPPRGAIGPLTVAILLEHTITAATERVKSART